ncbi:DUF4912 domain-containing protein [Moorella naiadis]|uniref:DUF4912 domain-containing protein n=1 Tax=Moorella naiadis (nom. illeg.) TaxID=3093670 RepID=UPI003D9C9BE2
MLDLSSGYHQNILVCLPQDLHTFYAYWDFTPPRMQTLVDFFQQVRPDMKLALRLYRRDVSLPDREVVLAEPGPGGSYFSNLDEGAVYHLELGARSPAGEFVVFSRTKDIQLQPVKPAELAGESPPSPGLMLNWTISLENHSPSSNFNWS